ncbi:MAG: adenylate kinase [Candidatus Latescibacterota bacterium]|nr:MAG: adenylate kinase [Candidatus Latescibacterota bacterium]
MNLVILGAPGSGKGTQAARIAEQGKIQHVSTGDLLRDAVAKQSPIGKQVESIMAAGKLVSDGIVLQLIRETLTDSDERGKWNGWILDGYPRNLSQAEALEGVLKDVGETVEGVVYIELDPDVIVERLSNRRTCASCKAVYHLVSKPPAVEGKCDSCGGELYLRDDDKPETIRKRLEVYDNETLPILGLYEKRYRVHRVDGSKPIDDVTTDITRLISL